METYYRTWNQGKVRTHLEGIGDSYTLCGLDTAGDDTIHDRDPVQLERGRKHRVTCEDCQQVIGIVRGHLGKSNEALCESAKQRPASPET